MKSGKHRHLEPAETAFPVEKINPIEITRRSVHAERQIGLLSLGIERIKKRMAEPLVGDQAAAEDAASAVGFGKPDFIHGIGHIEHWHRRDPAEPPVRLVANIDQPPIIAPADRLLYFGSRGQAPKKKRGIEELKIGREHDAALQ